ncbi:hypothetical protein BC826DRAFT_1064323 [Russula brevipes]|nr:hypothetical protein BC826DRAFT_1064323 [Russula brevipes]
MLFFPYRCSNYDYSPCSVRERGFEHRRHFVHGVILNGRTSIIVTPEITIWHVDMVISEVATLALGVYVFCFFSMDFRP